MPYTERYRADFERLNRAWIARHFTVEPGDEAELSDPEAHFVRGGGQVLFLVTGSGDVAGTVALLRHGDGFEVAKMTVDEAHRGRGYGDLLLAAAIRWAEARGGRYLELVTNSSLAPAIRLYEKHGFEHVPLLEGGEPYARADVRMRRPLLPPDGPPVFVPEGPG